MIEEDKPKSNATEPVAPKDTADPGMIQTAVDKVNETMKQAAEASARIARDVDAQYDVSGKVKKVDDDYKISQTATAVASQVNDQVKKVDEDYKISETVTALASQANEKAKEVGTSITNTAVGVTDASKKGLDIAMNPGDSIRNGATIVATKTKEATQATISVAKDLDSKYEVSGKIKKVDDDYKISETTQGIAAKGVDLTKQVYEGAKSRDPTGGIQTVEDYVGPYAVGLMDRITNLASAVGGAVASEDPAQEMDVVSQSPEMPEIKGTGATPAIQDDPKPSKE